MERSIFINLAVSDLDRAIGFFSHLGFEFDPRFTDETGTCMIVSDQIHVMLLTREKFAGFTPNKICNSKKKTEVLLCLSCGSRDEVDELVEKAVAAGGTTFSDPSDHGFMYGHGFQDPDGHIWELMHIDVSAMPTADD